MSLTRNNLKGETWNIIIPCKGNQIYNGCSSILQIEKEDINIRIKENKEIYYTFTCPCCNMENIIKKDLIPLHIKINALKKLRRFYERINYYE